MEKLTKEIYEDSIKKGVCLVAVGAPWCPDCRKIEPIMRILSNEYSNIKFFHLGADEEEELKDELGVKRIPTLIFYKDGLEVGERVVEPNSRDKIENAIKIALEA